MSLRMLRVALERPLPGQLTIAQPTTDVTEWDTLFAPDDDIHGALLAELDRAAAMDPAELPEVHSSQYGFTDKDVAQRFAMLCINRRSRLLFDKTQAAGETESPILETLELAVQADQWAVGSSPVHSQILHTKAVAILYADGSGWTMTGSFNLSRSAEQQFNIVDLVRSRSRAELFAARIDAMFDYVKQHEGGKQS